MVDISVIMSTYKDSSAFLTTCIKSVLNQTYSEIEFIIVAEPDEVNLDLLRNAERQDKRVKVLINERRLGIAGSRNRAIQHSCGNYIAIIDGDDYCDAERLEKQRNFLETNADISVVGSNLYLVGKDNVVVGERRYPELHKSIKEYFLLTMGIANPSVMVRRKDLDEVGSFDPGLMKAEDMELWLRFLRHGKKMHILQEYLVYYRLPMGDSSKRNKLHMQNVYSARKKHGRYIWSFRQRVFSMLLWFIISHIPDGFIDYILNSNITKRMRMFSAVDPVNHHNV